MTIISAPSNYFASVRLMKNSDKGEVLSTLEIWRKYLNPLSEEKSYSSITADYSIVLNILEDDVNDADPKKGRFVFLAKDNTYEIQSIASFHLTQHPGLPEKRALIDALVTAPWNYRWPVVKHPHPLRGGGLLLFFAIVLKAQKASLNYILLHATGTSFSFYEKIGMIQKSFNKFCLCLTPDSKEASINALFESRFGESIKTKSLVLGLD